MATGIEKCRNTLRDEREQTERRNKRKEGFMEFAAKYKKHLKNKSQWRWKNNQLEASIMAAQDTIDRNMHKYHMSLIGGHMRDHMEHRDQDDRRHFRDGDVRREGHHGEDRRESHHVEDRRDNHHGEERREEHREGHGHGQEHGEGHYNMEGHGEGDHDGAIRDIVNNVKDFF